MLEIFRESPWLLIVLAAFAVPIFGMILGAWTAWLDSRQRSKALEALQAFAATGREPPPELLAAVSGRRFRRRDYYRRHREGPPPAAAAAADAPTARPREDGDDEDDMLGMGSGGGSFWGDDPATSRAWGEHWRAHRRNEPLRSWKRAITLIAFAGAFYVAAQLSDMPDTERGFMIATVIVGAIALATLVSAILTSIFREK